MRIFIDYVVQVATIAAGLGLIVLVLTTIVVMTGATPA